MPYVNKNSEMSLRCWKYGNIGHENNTCYDGKHEKMPPSQMLEMSPSI